MSIQKEVELLKTETSVELKRVFSAPVAQVYQAWTDPEKMNKWFHPDPRMTSTCSVDLRVGGRYTVVMQSPRGEFTVAGEYKEIIPEEKLVFSWQWQGEEEYEITQVTLLFKAVSETETELTLQHGRFDTVEELDSHTEGWVGTYEQLAAFLD